jgi:hypothetical protein
VPGLEQNTYLRLSLSKLSIGYVDPLWTIFIVKDEDGIPNLLFTGYQNTNAQFSSIFKTLERTTTSGLIVKAAFTFAI